MQETNQTNITVNVVDAIMGSGKTSWILDKVNKDDNPRYIIITPTLSEVKRINETCPKANFKEPETTEHGGKYFDFKQLVSDGENIVTTHSLFKYLTKGLLDKIKAQKYTLVIDEAIDCVDIYTGITKDDLTLLLADQYLLVEPKTFKLKWNEAKHGDYYGKFDNIRRLCNNGNLIYFKEKTMLWEFPVEFLKVFSEVYVMTYLFKGSTMANYLEADGINVEMYSLKGKSTKEIIPTLIPYHETNEKEIKEKLRSLITVYEGKCNSVGSPVRKESPLSSTWYKKAAEKTLQDIKNNLSNFFKNFAKTGSDFNAWTTFKAYRKKLGGKGYVKGFVPKNTRATNDFIDKVSVAYTCNVFYHPIVRNYFYERKVKIYEDLYSLSEMLQFLWRFQIRRGDPVTLYIPSQRMRNLFNSWLNSDSVESLIDKKK